MKILMICTEKLPVPPVLGGAIQTYIAGSMPYMSEAHDITVLGVNDPTLPNQETIDGTKYVRIPGKIFEIYREEVVSYLENNPFDLIHIFNRPRLVLPVRQVAPNSKIVLSMHNDMFTPEKIKPDEATAVMNEVTSIVTISDYIGNVIRELYPASSPKLHTIYSGVDTDRFLPGNHPKMQKIRNETRKAHGLENKTVIMFAGRLSNNKGVDRLVRALPKLSNRFKDLALVIVGSKWFSQNDVTDYVAYIRALANKLTIPVVNTGFVAPSEIQTWFAAADLFVCTSIWQEPLARVHYEAMAAGLPIVTTARGGNAEVIKLGENGLVVEHPEDPQAFTEKITEILSNKSMMKRMGENGRKFALTLYQWDRVASDILSVWEKTMQTQHSSPSQDFTPVQDLIPSQMDEEVPNENLLQDNERVPDDKAPLQDAEQVPDDKAPLQDAEQTAHINKENQTTEEQLSPSLHSEEHDDSRDALRANLLRLFGSLSLTYSSNKRSKPIKKNPPNPKQSEHLIESAKEVIQQLKPENDRESNETQESVNTTEETNQTSKSLDTFEKKQILTALVMQLVNTSAKSSLEQFFVDRRDNNK